MVPFVRMNLALLRGEVWDGRGVPWRLLRPIGLEQAIYRADLGHIPTVRKGSSVTLLYEGKNLRMSVPGEALADGVPGESIPVRNSQSRKQLYGIVRDASTVLTSAAL
jgi:flagella basal body P-ring formation protein FlgA